MFSFFKELKFDQTKNIQSMEVNES